VALQRGYIGKGLCPGGSGSIAKVVAAVTGDKVQQKTDGIWINGHRWPWSSPIRKDWAGRTLPAQIRTYTVPNGLLLLMGLNPHSWDARYFGTIPSSCINGIAHPLLIERGDAAGILRQRYLNVGADLVPSS
jgi:conjugative transfer signal peptidase TraF